MIDGAVVVVVAVARVVERRIRTSRSLRRRARRLMAAVTKISREGRAFVRLRLMPIV